MGFRVDNNLEQWVHINANYKRQSSPGYVNNEIEEYYIPKSNIRKSKRNAYFNHWVFYIIWVLDNDLVI